MKGFGWTALALWVVFYLWAWPSSPGHLSFPVAVLAMASVLVVPFAIFVMLSAPAPKSDGAHKPGDNPPLLPTFSGLAGACVLVFILLSRGCGDSAEDIAARQARARHTAEETAARTRAAEWSREAEASIAQNRQDGRQALEQWDASIRDNTAERRARLERAAVRHTSDNRGFIRMDTYVLRDGRAIICATDTRGPGAPVMDCDGEP